MSGLAWPDYFSTPHKHTQSPIPDFKVYLFKHSRATSSARHWVPLEWVKAQMAIDTDAWGLGETTYTHNVCFPFTVQNPEESIERYRKVVRLVRQGHNKTDAYDKTNVDRNTIVSQAAIAELEKVNPKKYAELRGAFNKKSSLSLFAQQCAHFCAKEPQLSVIEDLKKKGELLDIKKK